MTRVGLALIDDLRQGLRRVADPSRAPRMQAYIMSAMPYLGVPSAGMDATHPSTDALVEHVA